MFKSTSLGSPYLMEPDYGTDSRIWDDCLIQWSDHSEYLLGRYVQIRATSTRDLHLGHVSLEGLHTPAAGHNPIIQTSRWEGRTAKGSSGYESSGAMGSSDGPSHLSATSTLPESTSNPVSAAGAAVLTPLPPSLLPLAVRTLTYAGNRLPEAEMMTVGLPAIPGEDRRGPPSRRPVIQSLDRRVDAPLGHLVISFHPPPMESPRHSLAVLRRLLLETL